MPAGSASTVRALNRQALSASVITVDRIHEDLVTDRAPVETTNLDRYGNAELPWSRPRDILAVGSLGSGTTHFLGTLRCTISIRVEGIDLVFEGHATRATDQQTLEQAAAIYGEAGWPAGWKAMPSRLR